MNVRDLILSDIPTSEANEITKVKRQRTRPVTTWEVVMSDACDGAIRRKTAKTSRLLVLLMSQGQFYIKDENNDKVEMLDATNLAKFLAGSNLLYDVVPWCDSIGGGSKKNAAEFVRIANDDNFQWLAKRGLHSFSYTRNEWRNSRYELQRRREELDSPIQKLVTKLGEETIGRERWAKLAVNGCSTQNATERKLMHLKNNDATRTMRELYGKYGIDWTREFVRSFITAPYVGNELPALWRLDSVLEVCNFDPTCFREYLFGESVRQGFGITDDDWRSSSLNNFCVIWSDTLSMQKTLRGKVYDKYPDDLAGLHQMLSFRCSLRNVSISEWKLQEHSARIAENELSKGDYLIRVPRNKDDMLDEATQQANCLASYINAYANDETDIYFMRSVDDPDKSLVTVEVRDGRIRQAYRACNRRPSDEELAWLNEWAGNLGVIGLDADHQRPLCA